MSIFPWKKKKAGEPAPRVSNIGLSKDPSGFVKLTITGVVTPKMAADCQNYILQMEKQSDKLRGLIDATEFEGFSRGFNGGFDELDRMFSIDKFLERMAVVADEKWHDSLALFFGVNNRNAEFKFFDTLAMDSAKAWVKSQ